MNKKLIGVRSGELLWLNTHDFLPAKPVQGAECRALMEADIQRLSLIKEFGIDEPLVKDFETEGFTGIGIFVNQKLVGLTLFATEELPAAYNTLSDFSNGLQIVIPPGTRCMFKAIVLPEFRGQRLHSAMVRFAIDHFGKDVVHTITATCCSNNKAFIASCSSQGFEAAGKYAEFCLFSKSFYRLPKPIDSLSGKPSDDEERAIVLRRAA